VIPESQGGAKIMEYLLSICSSKFLSSHGDRFLQRGPQRSLFPPLFLMLTYASLFSHSFELFSDLSCFSRGLSATSVLLLKYGIFL
jgi:hypothetical protein